MGALLALARAIDRVNEFIGKSVSWLILVAVLISATNAVIRKVFNTSSNAWLEAQWYLFGAAFLLASAYTLKQNEHIRIDIVYGAFSRRVQHWIDLFGHVFFLLPIVGLMLWMLWPYVMMSSCPQYYWHVKFIPQDWLLLKFVPQDWLAYLPTLVSDRVLPWLEQWTSANTCSPEVSTNSGGLIIWPAKSLLLIGFALLFAQGISEIIKKVGVMRGLIPDPHTYTGHHGTAEAFVEEEGL